MRLKASGEPRPTNNFEAVSGREALREPRGADADNNVKLWRLSPPDRNSTGKAAHAGQ